MNESTHTHVFLICFKDFMLIILNEIKLKIVCNKLYKLNRVKNVFLELRNIDN